MKRLKGLQILLISAKSWLTLPYSSETLVPVSLGDVGNIIHRCEAELSPGLQNTTSAQGIHTYIDNRAVQILYEFSISVFEGSIYAS